MCAGASMPKSRSDRSETESIDASAIIASCAGMARVLAARERGGARNARAVYLWLFIYPHGRAPGIFCVLAVYNEARPGGWAGGGEAGGRPPWGGAAARSRAAWPEKRPSEARSL